MRLNKVQIQVMTPHLNFGGGAFHSRGLARGLRFWGIKPTLLCIGGNAAEDLYSDPDYDEIQVHEVNPFPLLWRLDALGSLPSWIRAVRRHTQDVDAVISLSPEIALATLIALPRVPIIYAPACVDQVEHPDSGRRTRRWVEAQCYRYADRVLLTAPSVREAVERLYLKLQQPVGECFLGVDQAHACGTRCSRQELGIPANAPVLLTVGSINENKGQHLIAQALSQCGNSDWHWVIVGEETDEGNTRMKIEEITIKPKLHFRGFSSRVCDWYAAADVFVASSRHETFGLAIAEAIAAGLPVIIPRNSPGIAMSPLAEAVEKFKLGLTFERNDISSLAQSLTALLSNCQERHTISMRARQFSKINFDWRRYADCAIRLLGSNVDIRCPLIAP